jgi:undecaprenyl diphosphate synthase
MTVDGHLAPRYGADGGAPPKHVAVIMDGNGRWATARGMPRRYGHLKGVEALRRLVRDAGEVGIRILTIYSFSVENWTRPPDEISELMRLLKRFIRNDLAELHGSGVRVRVIGDRSDLDPEIRRLLVEAEELTRANDSMTLVVAFNYGARQEIVRAARALAVSAARGEIAPSDVTIDAFAAQLDTAGIPDPDLVIRTSGEQRLSNFLLWQAAYAELVFLPVLWPDFNRDWLEAALAEYARRERRFGGVVASTGG